MDKRAAWVLGILFGGGSLCVLAFLLVMYAALKGGDSSRHDDDGTDRVGVVEVTGPITESKRTLKDLEDFAEDKHIKAIVVRIDSPGGAVGPSQEIYDAIKRIKENKKVVASMGSMAASGGYYIACATDKIFSNAGTLTGSIGVIMELPNVQGLLKWAGVEMNTLKAGKMKDSGSPFRTMTDDERTYFQGMLADVHEQFIEAVAAGRGLAVEDVKPLADGRIFSGRQAKEAKLVDELGGIDAAVAEAAKLGGITGKPKTSYPHREKPLMRQLFGDDEVESIAKSLMGRFSASALEYRFAP